MEAVELHDHDQPVCNKFCYLWAFVEEVTG